MRTALLLVLAACGSAAPPPPPPPPAPAPPPPAAKPVSFTGIWLGKIEVGGKGLRVQVHLDLGPSTPTCALDSIDQGAMGIPCEHVVASPTELAFEVPFVKGGFKGTVSADGNTVTGTWSQSGGSLPLAFVRQDKALEPEKPAIDPPMDAVDIEKIQAVTDTDLAKVISGPLAVKDVGVTIGVIAHGTRKIFTYGAVKADSVFEIGSITKTFTGLALAQMVEQKKVKLDEPVRALLPKGTVAAPASGAEITLVDLSAQHSGLPRLPDNMKPADESNPYADYGSKELYAFLSAHGVALPAKPEFAYSNLGVGLLGQALAVRAGSTYAALIKKQIADPLGMRDTVVVLTPALTKRAVAGHGAGGVAIRNWDFDALAGAGAIRSTANDMLTYLDAQLHPDHVKGRSAEAKTLPAAITASHEIHGDVGAGMHIALNWMRIDETGSFWHNGATGGFSSFALFDASKDIAVIVLLNRSIEDGSLADDIGKHVAQRMMGRPAMTVKP